MKAAKKHAAMIWNSKHKGAEAVGPHRESIEAFCKFMEDNETMGVGMVTPMDKKIYTAKDKESTKPKGPNYPMDHRDIGHERGGMAEGNEENEQGLSGVTSSKELNLRDFKVTAPKAPKAVGRATAAFKKFKRDVELINKGAIFGENFSDFMEAHLDQNARRSIAHNLKSIMKSRNIELKRKMPPGDVEDAVASKLRTNAQSYRAGAKPWSPEDKEIEDHYHHLANKRQDLADKLKGK